MAHSVDVHVGRRLRHARWQRSLTRAELAEQVGLGLKQIQKYETGVNRISASRMWDLAVVLGLPIAFFFEGLEGASRDGGEAGRETLLDHEALTMVRAYHAIPQVQRRRLFDLARVLSTAA